MQNSSGINGLLADAIMAVCPCLQCFLYPNHIVISIPDAKRLSHLHHILHNFNHPSNRIAEANLVQIIINLIRAIGNPQLQQFVAERGKLGFLIDLQRQTASYRKFQEAQDYWIHNAQSFIVNQQLAQRFPFASLWGLHLRDIEVVYLVIDIPILQELTTLDENNLKMLQFLKNILIIIWKIDSQMIMESDRFHSLISTSYFGFQQAPVYRPLEPPTDSFHLGLPAALVVSAFEQDISLSSPPTPQIIDLTQETETNSDAPYQPSKTLEATAAAVELDLLPTSHLPPTNQRPHRRQQS